MCSGVNVIDASALEILESLVVELKELGIEFYMSEVKGPVMDKAGGYWVYRPAG